MKKYTLLKPLQIQETLNEARIKFLTPDLFMRIFGISASKAKYYIESQTQTGLFIRLKKGLYTLKTSLPTEEEMANAIYKPSYLSFEYALAHYGLLPEMVYIITSATTKPTRLFQTQDMHFSFRTIKKQAYTGYVLKKTEKKSFLIAEPEKALADYIYFLAQGKVADNDRLFSNVSKINKTKVLEYINLFDNKSTLDMYNKIYARS
ncbi:hypothetical protein HZB69_04125 [Candidatus Amesbacteria bacterium]|nr:hypothetical protein [Candidatus Amesbacteria bacterium]